MPLDTLGNGLTVFTGPHLVTHFFLLMRGPLGIGSGPPGPQSKFKVLPRGFKCLWILWGTVLRSLQVPTWLFKNILVDERSLGNRIRPTWTAIKVQSITSGLQLPLDTLGNGLSVFTGPHLVTHFFLLMRGPLGIGSGPPGPQSNFKVLPRGFKCLWILWGTVLRSLQVPTWLFKNILVDERSLGNRIRPTWTAIKVQSITSGLQVPLDTLETDMWILWGTVLRSLQVPTWLFKNILVDERSLGNRIRPTWTAIKVQSIISML